MLNIYVNTGSVDDELNVSGASFTEFASGSDKILFTAGSSEVASGQDSPSESQLISAGIILTGSEITVSEYLMLDAGSNLLRDIPLMGAGNNRYVLAFSFDAATASIPVLEIFDDDTLSTITATILGGGTPSNSFIRGITTTYSSPGVGWTGSRLAGSGSGNFLNLSTDALTGADVLYAQIKCVIPASQTVGFSANPVFVVKYLA
jgi:hypothetical protein